MFPTAPSALDRVHAAVDELAQEAFGELSDGELHEVVAGCADALCRVQAVTALAVGAWDGRGLWADDGAVNGGRWLAQRGVADGPHRVKIARALRDKAPVTAEAMRSGSLSYEKAAVIAGAVPENLADAFAMSEADIVDAATQVTAKDTKALMRAWQSIAEDDAGIDPDPAERRRARWDEGFRGGLDLRAFFDPLTGAAFKGAVDAKERELFLADLAEARALAGVPHDPDDHSTAGLDMPRSPAQRRLDALAELTLAGAGIDTPHGLGGPSAVLHVTVDHDTLTNAVARNRAEPSTIVDNAAAAAERARHRLHDAIDRAVTGDHTHGHAVLDDCDTPISDEALDLLACDCLLERITLDGNGVPLELGRTQRLASREQRRALRTRDGGCCAFPGCDRPVSWCDAHHIVAWILNGLTDLDNLVFLCRRHHSYVHRRVDRWKVLINRVTRRPEFYDPAGNLVVDPAKPPDARPSGRPPDREAELERAA